MFVTSTEQREINLRSPSFCYTMLQQRCHRFETCPHSKVGRESSVGIATRYGAGGSGDRIPVEARFSSHVQNGPGAQPASYTMGTGFFPGLKRPGRGVDHPPLSSAGVKEIVELYLYSSSGPSWPVLGEIYQYLYLCPHSKGRYLRVGTLGCLESRDPITQLRNVMPQNGILGYPSRTMSKLARLSPFSIFMV